MCLTKWAERLYALLFTDGARLVVKVGRFTEQTGPVWKTPHAFRPITARHKREWRIMAFQMKDTQQVTLTINPVDRKGNAAEIENVDWSTDNSEVLALSPSADGKSCLVAAVGPIGTATVTIKGDAQIGEGEALIAGSLDIEITSGVATQLKLVAGTPEEQPEPPPEVPPPGVLPVADRPPS